MSLSTAPFANTELLETNYQSWSRDPGSVDPNWAAFFEGFELGCARQANGAGPRRRASDRTPDEPPPQTAVEGMVYAYRTLGHTIAHLDPLNPEPPEQALLSLKELGFFEEDLDKEVTSSFFRDGQAMKLREMIDSLRAIYCGTVGFEFMHIQNTRIRNWLRGRIEAREEFQLSEESKRNILEQLSQTETFEHFLHTKYVGQKRFSLEGAESLLVFLHGVLEDCPEHGVEEIVMGMAHRGRLSVLANFLDKSLKVVFNEFCENYIPDQVCGDGDVKYHLGYETVRKTKEGREISICLAANPSHLEAVDPVVQGKARARQRLRQDTAERKRVLPLLIHGDAAFAGQGVVAEVFNFSQLPGYSTGGTLHLIVNNQIGFTTLPADARSSAYASDVAKMIEAPIFHVNSDDPEAVRYVTKLAFDFRQEFGSDVVIDLYCYRRHGHNESDEPSFTQPNLYSKIQEHPSVGKIYTRQLIEEGVLGEKDVQKMDKKYQKRLETALKEVREIESTPTSDASEVFEESTAVFQAAYSHEPVETAISRERLGELAKALCHVPEEFKVQPKIKRLLLDRRMKAYKNKGPYDWAFAEALAFGSLLVEGTPVRLSGQDSRRGTFSQRHSVLYDRETRERYIPLLNLTKDQAKFCVYNSLLSEAAVLGFDYGYSLDFPSMLCMWEAQFGDFCNGAQVIIDQFIVSAESKWQQVSGIVLLLPHGYEGQGPEHSSARLERFLQLAAEENIQVANLTTPAQYFHILRRQMKRNFRKPLVLMTPKSLLRHERAVSVEDDFTKDRFREILPDSTVEDPAKVDRVILCSGKVYYDLDAYRQEHEIKHTALIRVEQLYPLHEELLKEVLSPFENARAWIWCQEESRNMGAWQTMEPRLRELLGHDFQYAGRGASASPAVGATAVHKIEQKELIQEAFSL